MKFRMLAVVSSLVLATGSSVSACCLFPMFPTYSAGYAPWGGMNWGASYAPVSYGYGGANCCPGGSCGTNYSASYYGYSAGGCCSSCGTSCGGACGYGCGSACGGSCGSSCGGSCVGTETRKVPEPDSNYDSKSDPPPRSRTFGDDDARDRELEDGFRRPGSGLDDGLPPLDDRAPLNRDRLDRDGLERWDPSRSSAPSGAGGSSAPGINDSGSSSRGGSGMFTDDPPADTFTPGSSRFRPSEEQPVEPDADGERNAKKPAITTPMIVPSLDSETEESPASKTPEDTVPAPADGADPATGTDPGTETAPKDFLEPETDPASARSSHYDVLAMKRLAPAIRSSRISATQVSSSRTESRAPRWISLPLPAGRSRL